MCVCLHYLGEGLFIPFSSLCLPPAGLERNCGQHGRHQDGRGEEGGACSAVQWFVVCMHTHSAGVQRQDKHAGKQAQAQTQMDVMHLKHCQPAACCRCAWTAWRPTQSTSSASGPQSATPSRTRTTPPRWETTLGWRAAGHSARPSASHWLRWVRRNIWLLAV